MGNLRGVSRVQGFGALQHSCKTHTARLCVYTIAQLCYLFRAFKLSWGLKAIISLAQSAIHRELSSKQRLTTCCFLR